MLFDRSLYKDFGQPSQNDGKGIDGLGGDLLSNKMDDNSLLVLARATHHWQAPSRFHPHEKRAPVAAAPAADAPPSISSLLAQSINLNRIAKNDPAAADFSIERTNEPDFKERYVNEAIRVGAQEGFNSTITKDLVKRIYAFEGGGWGTAETLAGMSESMVATDNPDPAMQTAHREQFVPISSAVGYNQVIRPTTLFLIHEFGNEMGARLNQIADQSDDPQRKTALQTKAQLVQQLASTIDQAAATLPDAAKYYGANGKPTWDLFANLASAKSPVLPNITGDQLGIAVHSLNLDKDIGPLIQAENLRTLLKFAKSNNVLDLLNDRVKTIKTKSGQYDQLPPARQQKALGEVCDLMGQWIAKADVADPNKTAERIASVLSLQQKLVTLKPGDNNLLDRANLDPGENSAVRLIISHASGIDGIPRNFSSDGQLLVAKIVDSRYHGSAGQELFPAAMELVNLMGEGRAIQMLSPSAANVPASHWFTRQSYAINPIAHGHTAGQLLQAIYHVMNEHLEGSTKHGLAELTHYLDNAGD